ncbi:bifunctional [glutamine synthetase] adenylyltransferase/[glutamine synthetase]-adenylyl-L-tyrosine phosphorylase [Rhizobium sp. L1K21]|uniref:bifunctional [glutamine synthetase] adenylyltransferase/[glutamine synthetase]-adenylyl-L-tyrosine phosphorylase n=1 Tax=Rhizobium sp. L1K21 TaxID=2954933 RepID=UPI002092CFDB|nr:bifunctional [glutamine synthetase] adenylyltransferase/[glutamine synthetase]-adenylyl-L-tyrosine phosphorylase [Rhizobium sp. L1K21]
MPDNEKTIATFLTENPLHPLNKTEARAALSVIRDVAKAEPALGEFAASETPLRDFAVAALSLSPFLKDTVQVTPALLEKALFQPLDSQLDSLIDTARNAWRADPNSSESPEAQVMNRLRQIKRETAFLIAFADLARLFDASATTAWLSRLAEACIAAAVDFLLHSLAQDGKVRLKDENNPALGSGLIVLGMGKLGAGELNYSSDIDLVIFYEPEAGLCDDIYDLPELLARMARRLLRILQERTAYGYVFRTDLRLRPDPGSTPLAIPVEAALIYYESRGQNWERAAYIKAKPVAGDIEAGQAFLKELTPFIFRKYLDYAAIADIHSIKRQIHAHKGFGEIAVKGHNVKLGRGGIREIEFFAQTQQLIAAGRLPDLRVRRTEDALYALTSANWIDKQAADELCRCYWFLRDIEHRIQMVHDEQTHILPKQESELKRIAFMAGFDSVAAFSAALEKVLRTVERRYAQLFENEGTLASKTGNLVFTGQRDDPGTLETLASMGFERPQDVARVVRTWHSGRYRATQSAEARERLTELTPQLMEVFGQSKRADEAIMRFDEFLKGLPAGIQLFSLLGNNPSLLSLLVLIMSSAPRLAATISGRPHVFDGMLDPALMQEMPTRAYLSERLENFLSASRFYEETLDRLRIFAAEQRFLIGIRLLTEAIDADDAARAFSDLADLVIEAALTAVKSEIQSAHGAFPGGEIVVLGMGKLGSRELTAGSDVDLILLYDHDSGALESDGEKPLDATRYFTRITQRLIAALSAPTAEGVLYEVDMRLRPSGNQGPVATRINAFEKYQKEEAWTWEHMALTRARIICGDAGLGERAETVIGQVLSSERDKGKIAADVFEMRTLIDKEKPAGSIWDLKLIAGGLIDIEFVAQFLRLTATADDSEVEGLTGTFEVLGNYSNTLDANDLEPLRESFSLYSRLSQVTRLCTEEQFDPQTAPAGLVEMLCRAGECPDIKTLESEIKRRSKSVRAVFRKLVGP